MELNKIYNEDCIITMNNMKANDIKADVILTSPPYNTSRGVSTKKEVAEHKSKYGDFKDNLPNDEYRAFMVNVVNHCDKVLKDNGVFLLNLSYASSHDIDSRCSDMIRLMYDIIDKTSFDIADIITWKKKSALPNNRSKNKLTRIVEYIFVLCRKDEYMTFESNKQMTSYIPEKNLKYYENIFNFIDAKNNDGTCPHNKATYSTELCEKLLNIYAKPNSLIYDPFMGTGTTAVACKKLGHTYLGSELSHDQCKWAENRLLTEN